MIFDGVVCAPGEERCDFGPFGAVNTVRMNDGAVFIGGPSLLFDIGVEMVVPALPALLADAAGQKRRNKRPLFRAVLVDKLHHGIVLLFAGEKF